MGFTVNLGFEKLPNFGTCYLDAILRIGLKEAEPELSVVAKWYFWVLKKN